MLTLYIADVERDAGMKNLSRKEAAKVLEDMKVKIEIPKAAVTQWKRNTALDMAIEALVAQDVTDMNDGDMIYRQEAIDSTWKEPSYTDPLNVLTEVRDRIKALPSAQPDSKELSSTHKALDTISRYEYHYDHTDCIWYRPEARNRCPVTCAQYRDGWNDAMNYIFRDGKGYRPYRRGEKYE